MNDTILRELIEEKISTATDILTLKITQEKDLREAREKSAAQALALQGAEYERRLTELNHAHALAQKDRETYLRADTFFTYRGTADERVGKLELSEANAMGRWWGIGLVASGIGGGVGFLAARMMGIH